MLSPALILQAAVFYFAAAGATIFGEQSALFYVKDALLDDPPFVQTFSAKALALVDFAEFPFFERENIRHLPNSQLLMR